ncbi:MAG: hypothetical protein RLZZ50_1299 [Verrucomicrobiota bacterium]
MTPSVPFFVLSILALRLFRLLIRPVLAVAFYAASLTASALAQDIDPSTGPATPYPGTPVSGYRLAWSDEFNAPALDTSKWNFRTDTRFWSLQRAANVRVANGILHLDLKKETFGSTNYTGGGLISKKLFRYGYYEARMRVPPGGGWHTSFWMMKYNRPATDTVAIELDAIENDSVTPLKYSVNTHRHLPTPHLTYGFKNVSTPSLNADFYVFGCEFTPTVVRYFFNGTVVQTVSASQFPHNDLNIWLTSIAAPLGGTTSVDDTQLPASAQFDYARFFAPGPVATLNLLAPGAAGVTLARPNIDLRVAVSATSSDPSIPPILQWSKASGPGEVTFANPSAVATTVRFSTPGAYTLQCQASVDGNPTTVQIPVGVAAPVPATFRQSFDGYQHIATFIRGDSPGWNSGARDQIIVGRWGDAGMRMLFSFDLAGLPADAAIEDATLDLWTTPGAGTGIMADLELRPLLSLPVEGTGNSSSASTNGAGTGATWSSRTGGSSATDLWTTPGADFGPEILATVPGYDATLTSRPLSFVGTPAFAALAESARAAGTPLNLLVLCPGLEASSTNAISRINSDDGADAELRPRLTVYYRGNYAPDPDPGPAPAATSGIPAALSGTASAGSSALWSLVSAPAATPSAPAATVSFANPASPSTSATFSAPGNYVLRLTAANALAETSRTLAVSVAPPPLTPLQAWRVTHFGPDAASGSGLAADLSDPDADNRPNLLEFALGTSPLAPETEPNVRITNNSPALTLTFFRARPPGEITYEVQASQDLLSPASWSIIATNPGTPGSEVSVTDPAPLPFSGARFLRLRVSAP